MKKKILLLLTVFISITSVLALSPRWIDIILRQTIESSFKIRSIKTDSLTTARHILGSCNQIDSLEITTANGLRQTYSLDSIERCELRHHIPTIYINTDTIVNEITSKEEYLKGTFSMSSGLGIDCEYDSISPVSVNIRGRGNSTWTLPKKPYRLKFDKKISICGLTKAKNYVLIANYIDPTLLHNATAFEIGRQLGMPYTNHSIPVDVYLNGRYCGSYILSEKIGINGASVDIDEEKGLLLEMDVAMDEDFCYRTPKLYLPVMVKDPDLNELAEIDTTITAKALFDSIQAEYNAAELSLFSTNKDEWLKYYDLESVVNYVLVQNVTGNWDFVHPKSLYLYRETKGDKFKFGPIWDFDWTADYYVNMGYEIDYGYPLFTADDSADMFRTMTRSEAFWDLYRDKWEYYKTHIWPEVKSYILRYTTVIESSAYSNGELWHPHREDSNRYYWKSTSMLHKNVENYILWLERRMEYIDQSPSMGLYW